MVIAVSGMIGSGKSTLTKELKEIYKNSILVEEFADEDPVFNKFLKWIYEKEPNIDIAFQSYIIESLSDTFKKEEKKFLKLYSSHKNGYMFLDRFNIEHYIFAIVTLEKKDKKYLKAFDALFQHIVDPSDNPDLAIYLDANFDVIKERILARGRAVEVDNFAENEPYFQRLHELYKELFVKLCLFYNIPYKIINTNNKKDYEVQEEAEEIINNFEFSRSKRA
ncbi:deoxyguanosine kinase [Mycoplasmopsis canis UF31]|uniref:deoxynucleoside kinase n=1 Tax=Mycoplasmopsis canis TaxID=29555 RepID=UPI00025AD9CB|nr:deoxynucleoside kinase [Mycoplasmopsis canis]EIE40063.1 deoxyguanosine kinase [Mycoplasmopsis canis UF31]WQQ12314.1 deoxynucleoside kinase [Mycoplasmopsis canis]